MKTIFGEAPKAEKQRGLMSALRNHQKVGAERVSGVEESASVSSFATIVEMIDTIVDDRMGESDEKLRRNDNVGASRQGVVERLERDLDFKMIPISMATTGDSISKAIEVFHSTSESFVSPISGEDSMSALIDQWKPFSVVVNGIERDLLPMSYEEMQAQLEQLMAWLSVRRRKPRRPGRSSLYRI